MKATVKNTFCSILFIAILIALLALASQVVRPKNNTKQAGMHEPRANGILAEPNNTIDVLLVGDSEIYSSIIPLKLWQNYGITSYTCGTPGQKLFYSLEFLENTFKTQNPKVVFLETNAIFRRLSYEGIISNKAEQYLPVFRYHDRWKSLNKNDWFSDTEYTYIEQGRGYKYNTSVKPAKIDGYMKATDKKTTVKLKNKLYVEKIRDYCEENGAKLVLISTPSTKNWNYKRHNSIEELAENIGVEYIDMNVLRDEIPIDWSKDTRDKGDHLNYSGSLKATEYLGKYLKNKNIFEDKRELPEYSAWNSALNDFDKSISKK